MAQSNSPLLLGGGSHRDGLQISQPKGDEADVGGGKVPVPSVCGDDYCYRALEPSHWNFNWSRGEPTLHSSEQLSAGHTSGLGKARAWRRLAIGVSGTGQFL